MEKYIKWYTGFIPLIFIVVSGIVHCFAGNPVSKIIAGKTLDAYIDEKYPGYYYEDYSYDFTCNGYIAFVYSPQDPDIKIFLRTDMFGKEITEDRGSLQ